MTNVEKNVSQRRLEDEVLRLLSESECSAGSSNGGHEPLSQTGEVAAPAIVARLFEHYAKLKIFADANFHGFNNLYSHSASLNPNFSTEAIADKSQPQDSSSTGDDASASSDPAISDEPSTVSDIPNLAPGVATGPEVSAPPPKCQAGTTIRTESGTEQKDLTLVAYQLAATDLFVEKALDFLKARAEGYKRMGQTAYFLGLVSVVIAAVVAAIGYFNPWEPAGKAAQTPWLEYLSHFVTSFTLYGLLILFSVSAWRLGKAMLDQSERLYEKRHAMRKGRLYVHLKKGSLDIGELEKAFTLNASSPNAFSDISTDAKAPWGSLFADAFKAIPDIAKALKASGTP